jgi:hypothetical protein
MIAVLRYAKRMAEVTDLAGYVKRMAEVTDLGYSACFPFRNMIT